MYALCVSGAVNTQGFVWNVFYALYINFHSFIHTVWTAATGRKMCIRSFHYMQLSAMLTISSLSSLPPKPICSLDFQ